MMQAIPTNVTLLELFKANLETEKTVGFITGSNDESQMTFRELYTESLVWLGRLQAAGVNRGDKVVIFLKDNRLFVEMFWACLLGGIIPVPVAQGNSREHYNKLLNVVKQLGSCRFFIEQASLDRLNAHIAESQSVDNKQVVISNALLSDSLKEFAAYEAEVAETIGLDDLAFIQFSSGSTRQPKGIMLSHRNLMTNICDMAERVEYEEDWVALSWMPLTHDMGLIGFHLLLIARGINHYIMDTNLFARRPLVFLQKIHEKRVNFTCSPNFGFKHILNSLKSQRDLSYDLSCVDGIICGAEPISFSLLTEFMNELSRFALSRNCIRPSYGLAEAGLAVAIARRGDSIKTISLDRRKLSVGDRVVECCDPATAIVFTLLGDKLSNCHVRFVDDNGKVLEENVVGKLEISGDNVTQGYFGLDGVNCDAIANGWLDTGDLGFYHNDEIVITGRVKDVIIIQGQNYYSHDLENILEISRVCSLGQVVVAAYQAHEDVGDKILVFIRWRGELVDFAEKVYQAKKSIFQTTGLEVFDVVPVKQIPKTTSGKVRRFVLVEAYANSDYKAELNTLRDLTAPSQEASQETNGDLSSDQVSEKVLTHIHEILNNPEIQLADNLFELGADSAQLVELSERVNRIYPDCIDVTDFYDCETVKSLADIVFSRTAKSA